MLISTCRRPKGAMVCRQSLAGKAPYVVTRRGIVYRIALVQWRKDVKREKLVRLDASQRADAIAELARAGYADDVRLPIDFRTELARVLIGRRT